MERYRLHEPFEPVYVADTDAFEKRNYKQCVAAGEAVHQLEDVATGTVGKAQGQYTTGHAQGLQNQKLIISFGTLGNSFISISEVLTPSSVPNCESIPSVNSIRKNRTAHSCAAGNWLIASVKMMNANPITNR
uniref:Uncharacterized protein n=1 Tax=Anopheles melas TaxID=34690 RepID=A0A182TFU7_9DIPT